MYLLTQKPHGYHRFNRAVIKGSVPKVDLAGTKSNPTEGNKDRTTAKGGGSSGCTRHVLVSTKKLDLLSLA